MCYPKVRLVERRTGLARIRFAKAEKQSEQANEYTAGGEEETCVQMVMIRACNQQSGRADDKCGTGKWVHGDNGEFS